MSIILSLSSDALSEFKNQFNQKLTETLAIMEQKETDGAEITVKFTISTDEREVDDKNARYVGATRHATMIHILHKITSTLKIKNEESGGLVGENELFWDRRAGAYAIRQNDQQVGLFDRTDEEEGYDDYYGDGDMAPACEVIGADDMDE